MTTNGIRHTEAGASQEAWSRVGSVSDGVEIGQRVVIEPGCRLIAPRLLASGRPSDLRIFDDVIIGAGALVAGAARIGPGARVEPGAVVLDDVPPQAIVAGNPAVVVGYSTPAGPDRAPRTPQLVAPPPGPGAVELLGGARLYRLPTVVDLRGSLTHAEAGKSLPFVVNRVFMVHAVPSAEVRGEHAHRTCQQYLICPSGSLRVSITDGHDREDVVLDTPDIGMYLPTMVWATQFQYSRDAVLLVLCSEVYDARSYIRDYAEFAGLSK